MMAGADFDFRLVTCPGCKGQTMQPGFPEPGTLPCLHCCGRGLVEASHAERISAGARLQRWVRQSGLPIMYFARAFGIDATGLADIMFGRAAMPENIARGLRFFEATSPSNLAQWLLDCGDEVMTTAAQAIHDGPLGAAEYAEFDSQEARSASAWCREVFTTALMAVAVAPVFRKGGES